MTSPGQASASPAPDAGSPGARARGRGATGLRPRRRWAVPCLAIAVLGLGARPAAAPPRPPDTPRTPEGYRLAVAPYVFEFPRDHASHPAYQTEWWYYTGHLRRHHDASAASPAGAAAADVFRLATPAPAGDTYGFELTFFRVGIDPAREHAASAWAMHTLYFAHFALTDERGRTFRHVQRAGRPALGMSGADSARLHVWIDDWSVEADGDTHHLRAAAPEFAIDLVLTPLKPPVVHGRNGVSQKADGLGRASHYYSLTRLGVSGELSLGTRAMPVDGLAWMDHEFGSNPLAADQEGWDWFSVQLDDGRELMLYQLRRAGGGVDPHSSGTLVDRDGRGTHLDSGAFTADVERRWVSTKTGGDYPAGWTVRVPGAGIALRLEPTVADQELAGDEGLGIDYWEGSVRVSGSVHGREARGVGYVELTGYAGSPPTF